MSPVVNRVFEVLLLGPYNQIPLSVFKSPHYPTKSKSVCQKYTESTIVCSVYD